MSSSAVFDGHLHRELGPDMPVDVEILDVTEDEARTIDPLAALAQTQDQIRDRLHQITPIDDATLKSRRSAKTKPGSCSPPSLRYRQASRRLTSSS